MPEVGPDLCPARGGEKREEASVSEGVCSLVVVLDACS